MLFNPKNRSIKFRLILEIDEFNEIRSLVEENGGMVCDSSKIIFTNFKTYTGNEEVFDINYIRECVRAQQLLQLIDYKIGKKGLYGCLMNIFINDNKYCPCKTSYSNCSETQALEPAKSIAVLEDDHNYVHRDITDEEEVIPETNIFGRNETLFVLEGTGDTEFSDSFYAPGDSEVAVFTPSEYSDIDQNSNETIYITKTSQAVASNSALDGVLIGTSPPEPRNNSDHISSIFPLSAAEEVAEEVSPVNCNNENESSQEVQILFQRLISPTRTQETCSKNVVKKLTLKSEDTARQSVVGSSDDCETALPVVRRSDRIKVIGVNGSSRKVPSIQETSSDSDETVYDGNSPKKSRRRNLLKNNAKIRCRKLSAISNKNTKVKESTDKAQPGTSRPRLVSQSSEDEWGAISASSDSEGSQRRRIPLLPLSSRKKNPQQLNDEKNGIVSSTRSTNQKSSSDDLNLVTQNKRTQGDIKKKRNLLSRNFATWEQKQMIKYLIDTESISEGKGNRIWKQMIHDGFLEHRTFQSLNNHFRRTILPNIKKFNLDPKIQLKFERLRP